MKVTMMLADAAQAGNGKLYILGVGRGACRGRVEISGGGGSLKKKKSRVSWPLALLSRYLTSLVLLQALSLSTTPPTLQPATSWPSRLLPLSRPLGTVMHAGIVSA